MADADESIAKFVAVTAAPPEEARQYLTATGGDVERAVEAFFAGGGSAGGGGGGALSFRPFFPIDRSNASCRFFFFSFLNP
jgi:hypothetical protein